MKQYNDVVILIYITAIHVTSEKLTVKITNDRIEGRVHLWLMIYFQLKF